MRTPEDIVRAEVCACASSLIATLAAGVTAPESFNATGTAVNDICEQAFDLAAPIDDWDEAAIQAGWIKDGVWHGYDHDKYPNWLAAETNGECSNHDTAQEACEANDIDPYQREVFEHWIVTEWLAEKLEAQGEKVDKDFDGLCIWARTTTGQMIAADAVLERVAKQAEADYLAAIRPFGSEG